MKKSESDIPVKPVDLRPEVSIFPLKSPQARTAYSFAEVFVEELKLVYESRQQRAKGTVLKPWSDGLIQLAATILDRAKLRSKGKDAREESGNNSPSLQKH